MKCPPHTEAETRLRCGKCGVLICPRCMVQTPVGARCAACARVRPVPTYSVSMPYYLRAAATGLAAAPVAALIWSLIDAMIPFLYLGLIIAGGVGYGIAELISLATNRKRGRGLAFLGGACFVLTFAIKLLFWGPLPFGGFAVMLTVLALVLGVFSSVNHLK